MRSQINERSSEMKSAFRKVEMDWVRDYLLNLNIDTIVTNRWKVIDVAHDGIKLMRIGSDSTIIFSGGIEEDNRRWLHVSYAHPRWMPGYIELKEAKDLFIGPELEAYQVFPKALKHVSIHPNCLHLWCCLDNPILPDFTRGGLSI